MTGYELLQKVRSDPAHTHVPFIMVTAELKSDNVIAARKAGVNNYIVKPFNAAAEGQDRRDLPGPGGVRLTRSASRSSPSAA